MKQLLLRVPEVVRHRLAARAARKGRSVNPVAGDRRARLRTAAAAGSLHSTRAARVSGKRRQRIVASTRGLGRQLDRLLDEERERP